MKILSYQKQMLFWDSLSSCRLSSSSVVSDCSSCTFCSFWDRVVLMNSSALAVELSSFSVRFECLGDVPNAAFLIDDRPTSILFCKISRLSFSGSKARESEDKMSFVSFPRSLLSSLFHRIFL